MYGTGVRLELIERSPAYWRVVMRHPPLNLLDFQMVEEFQAMLSRMEDAPELVVVVFESGVKDYFIAHADLSNGNTFGKTPGPTGLPPIADVMRRLESAPFVSVALVRGRARGVGNELLLAMDLRFASRELAVLGQPEVGCGLHPGCGAMERLPPLLGRARALEVILGAEDYSSETAERYGWINYAVPDAELDAFVERYACRLARFGRVAVSRAKSLFNERAGLALESDLTDSQQRLVNLLNTPAARQQMQALLERGLQQDSLFERNLGSLLGLQ